MQLCEQQLPSSLWEVLPLSRLSHACGVSGLLCACLTVCYVLAQQLCVCARSLPLQQLNLLPPLRFLSLLPQQAAHLVVSAVSALLLPGVAVEQVLVQVTSRSVRLMKTVLSTQTWLLLLVEAVGSMVALVCLC